MPVAHARNLVSTWDYFRPTAELNLAGPPSQRLAQFTPAVEPMLRPLGDYIGRMTLLRIDFWRDGVQKLVAQCGTVSGQGCGSPAAWSRFGRLWESVGALHESIRGAITVGVEAQIAQAATALVQAYRDYRPSADLSWLELPDATRRSGIGTIRHRIERRHDQVIGDQIAAAIRDLSGLYRESHSHEEALAKAVATKRLVLSSVLGRFFGRLRGSTLTGTRIP